MVKLLGNQRSTEWTPTLNITSNASGAAKAARKGDIVMIVDIIDMSTTIEATLDAGALDAFGASPDHISLKIQTNPEKIGYFAAKKALKYDSEVVLITEPRLASREEREKNINLTLTGIKRAGAEIEDIIPNLGAEVVKLLDFEEKVVVAITETGGVAYDVAYNHGAPEVITGTIARTFKKKGAQPARISAQRAIRLAQKFKTGITLVAASSNSYEDILAAEHIGKLIIEEGFLEL
ncbi:hypothetical protein [Fuchsiella alkaliacetigena]|uniref:hypothetical protein n=1 Tax=Fuchsiella alkaliacetigena TaxID=957042 RepID=UPI00200B72BD|nr:hypothetical protein [Fuchsiella alkaliacetigena]MCK8824755.1 hypothetical protein [Fuchsiella alkaliacetigena]